MKFTYLLVEGLAAVVPLLFSFHPSIQFNRRWRYFFPAMLIVALLFIGWDMAFTSLGVWSFNANYISGLHLFNLPLEEVLFFILIPFACTFTWYCLDRFTDLSWNYRTESMVVRILAVVLFTTGLLFLFHLYTSVCFISTAILLVGLLFSAPPGWLGKAISAYIYLLIPFFLVNGILTGAGLSEPVVIYNNAETLGWRIFTIPVEDLVYGFELYLLNLFLFGKFQGNLHLKGRSTIIN